MAGRSDIEALPAIELHPGRAEVQLDTPFVAMSNPKAGVLVGFEARESQVFELIHDLPLLVFGRRVLGCKANHARCIAPFVRCAVD